VAVPETVPVRAARSGEAMTRPALPAVMASWLTIALVLILIGLLFGVGLFVEAGKVILLVILALLLIGVIGGALYRGRRPAT